ncbi:MAG: hypothetical protein LUQ57_00415, partial [Methylococcaceae bacterium]|nr:hypothetical protein [Methylococcaceae bacterium]
SSEGEWFYGVNRHVMLEIMSTCLGRCLEVPAIYTEVLCIVFQLSRMRQLFFKGVDRMLSEGSVLSMKTASRAKYPVA